MRTIIFHSPFQVGFQVGGITTWIADYQQAIVLPV